MLAKRVIGGAAAVVSLVVACSGGGSGGGSSGGGAANVKCIRDNDSGVCDCMQQDRTVGSTSVVVSMCDAPTSGTWECCYDVDTSGYTNSCTCATWSCVDRGTTCDCGFGLNAPQAGETKVQTCTGALCSERSGTDKSCACSDNPNAILPGETVSSCTKRATYCSSGSRSATTCAGLNWKPAPPPSTGECIRNGNACGPAKQANGSCCSGYCGENGTCEMK